MALMMQLLVLGLLPWAFLLPPGGWAGEIVGGREARPHSRPYMTFLRMHRGNNTYRCGGFLVAKDFVLTAAHCQGDSISVTLGAHNVDKRERSQQVIRVRQQIPHPQYDKMLNNDIMLLQLAEPARLNIDVSLLCLPPAHQEVPPGTVCSVAGWGRTRTDRNKTSATLQEVELKVQGHRVCRKIPGVTDIRYNPSTMMCVGDPNKPQASFKGDSGGPLVCRGLAQGIVSWGSPSGVPPRVFVRLSACIPWIYETMKELQAP